jgi:BirA family biotin operon repressor/biotin-[acetyl-CoA-carboxylase] ligase
MRPSAHDRPSTAFPSPEDFIGILSEALPGFGAIDWVSNTGSTNTDLSLRAQRGRAQQPTPPRPWLLGAHLQTAGKGRAGRPWTNEAGSTLMFSCAFATEIPLAQLPGIAPALGVATCLALRALMGTQPDDLTLAPLKLKWPNDLQWHGAKLAGLLIETAPSSTVIVGMGLNLRGAAVLSAQLGREIADLGQIEHACSRSVHPADLVAHVAQAWQHALHDYTANGYTAFTHSFDIVDALAGQSVQVMDQGNILHQGIAQGTDALGRLRVMTKTGVVPVLVGDVSIRPAHPHKGTP